MRLMVQELQQVQRPWGKEPGSEGSCPMACGLVGCDLGRLCPEKGGSHWQVLGKPGAQHSIRAL